jgi:hypothetical protein
MNTSNRARIWADIRFPATSPAQGLFSSLEALSARGYLNGCTYEHALKNAGFEYLVDDTSRRLDVAEMPRGVFRDGMGKDAELLLHALAADGFEGSLHVRCNGTATEWLLVGGRALNNLARTSFSRAA